MNAQADPSFIERRKSDTRIDDPIDDEILREIRDATDDAEKRRLMIDYQMNRQLWRLGSLVSDISAKISAQDAAFEAHREEIRTILSKANEEYQAHRKEFMQHATAEEKLISNGQTAYRVVAAVGGAILILSWYILRGHFDELRDTQAVNGSQAKEIAELRRQIDLLDSAFGRHLITGFEKQQASGVKLPER